MKAPRNPCRTTETMNALTARPGVACGEVSLATAGITTTTRVAATTRNRPAPARRMTCQTALRFGAVRVPRCPATDPARHPMQPASNMGTPCVNTASRSKMKRTTASGGTTMAARMGQSSRSRLLLFRTARNWQTARYRATAIQPARTSWIEVSPRASKGSAPRINTRGESKPSTTQSTIFPIRPEITSRLLRKSFRNPYKSPTESPPPAGGADPLVCAGPPGPALRSKNQVLATDGKPASGPAADEGVRPTVYAGVRREKRVALGCQPAGSTSGPARNNGSARTASRAGSNL